MTTTIAREYECPHCGHEWTMFRRAEEGPAGYYVACPECGGEAHAANIPNSVGGTEVSRWYPVD